MKNRDKSTTIPQITYTTNRVFLFFLSVSLLKSYNKNAPQCGACIVDLRFFGSLFNMPKDFARN